MKAVSGVHIAVNGASTRRSYARGAIHYDAVRRRLWVGGQRMHHGMTGSLLATAAVAGLVAQRFTARGGLEWAILGTVLMAHDWHDRSHWFRRGAQDDAD